MRGATLANPGASNNAASAAYLTGASSLMTHCVISNNVITGLGTPINAVGITTPGVYLAGGAQLWWTLVADNADYGAKDYRLMPGDTRELGCYEPEAEAAVCFAAPAPAIALPAETTLTASVTGLSATGLVYAWDFDGDGTTDLVTTDATATWTYTQAGNVSVSLSATDVTSGASGECARGDYLYLVPKAMLVAASSPAPAFPYDTWQNAATNVQDAIDAAIDGVTIVFSNGVHIVRNTISVEKGVTLRGLADAPGDVVLANANAVRILRLNHAGSLVSGLVLTGEAGKEVGAFLCIDTVGGTVSNCVIRGVVSTGSVGAYANTAMMYVAGANSLMTHCVWSKRESFEKSMGAPHR